MVNRRSFLESLGWPATGLLLFRPGGGTRPHLAAPDRQEDPAGAVQELIDAARAEGERTVRVPDRFLPYPASEVDFDPEILLVRRGQEGGVADAAAYGASGSGEPGADDAALAAAHEAALHREIPLCLPAGHRYVTTLAVRTSVTTSPDHPAVLQLPPDGLGPALLVESSGVTIHHLEVDGAADAAAAGSAGIRLADVDDCRVTRCHVHDTLGAGITVRGARNAIVGNRLERCHPRRGSIETEASTVDTLIADNVVHDAGHHGIRVANAGTRGTVVRGNRVTGTGGVGILQEVRASDTIVIGNVILRSGGNGVKVEDGGTAVVSDNTVRDAGANGIFVHSNPGSTVTGNVISSPGRRGVVLATGADDTSVCGNTILDPSQEGIVLADSANCVLSGNTVSRAPGDGVVIEGDATGYVVTGNAVSRAGGRGIRDAARGSRSRVDVNSGR